MARHSITLIPGDGIGYEVSEAARRVIDATGVDIDWDVQNAGLDVVEQYGQPMPDHVLEFDPPEQGGHQGAADHSDRHTASAASTWRCAASSTSSRWCVPPSGTRACAAATRTSTWW